MSRMIQRKDEKVTGKSKELRHDPTIESPSMRIANERARFLQDCQTKLFQVQNEKSVTGKRIVTTGIY